MQTVESPKSQATSRLSTLIMQTEKSSRHSRSPSVFIDIQRDQRPSEPQVRHRKRLKRDRVMASLLPGNARRNSFYVPANKPIFISSGSTTKASRPGDSRNTVNSIKLLVHRDSGERRNIDPVNALPQQIKEIVEKYISQHKPSTNEEPSNGPADREEDLLTFNEVEEEIKQEAEAEYENSLHRRRGSQKITFSPEVHQKLLLSGEQQFESELFKAYLNERKEVRQQNQGKIPPNYQWKCLQNPKNFTSKRSVHGKKSSHPKPQSNQERTSDRLCRFHKSLSHFNAAVF